MTTSLLKYMEWPGEETVLRARPGETVCVTGVNAALAAAIACRLAERGKRVLLVADNDLKAARTADDIRQLTGGRGAFLPVGEIDLTRAAGSQESSWRRLAFP